MAKVKLGLANVLPAFPGVTRCCLKGKRERGSLHWGTGKCLCTYSKAWEVKSKKEPGEQVRRREKDEGEEVRSPGGREGGDD